MHNHAPRGRGLAMAVAAALAACMSGPAATAPAAVGSAYRTQVILPPEYRDQGQFGTDLTTVPDAGADGADDFAVSTPRPEYGVFDARHPHSYSDGRGKLLIGAPLENKTPGFTDSGRAYRVRF